MHELRASGRARMNQKIKATSINMCSLVKQLFVKSLLIKRLKAFNIFIERGLCYADYTLGLNLNSSSNSDYKDSFRHLMGKCKI